MLTVLFQTFVFTIAANGQEEEADVKVKKVLKLQYRLIRATGDKWWL